MAALSRSCIFRNVLLLAMFLLLGTGCSNTLHWVLRIPSLSPEQLSDQLDGPNPPLILDIRNTPDYQEGHIPGAKSINLEGIEGYLSRISVPLNRPVVVVCYTGKLSTLGAAAAAAWHRGEVHDLAGGMEAWSTQSRNVEWGEGDVIPTELTKAPEKRMNRFHQGVAFFIAAFIKPFYMLLCFILILVLARTSSTPLRLLFWGLVCFDVGEAFCALDLFFGTPGNPIAPLDLLHGAGMVGMGVLVPWGLMRLADERVVRYGELSQACVVQRFCGLCWKHQQVSCGLHRLFIFTLPALALLSLIPLSFAPRPVHYVSQVFRTTVYYGAPLINECVELWGYTILGSLSFLMTWLMLRGGGPESTRRAELPFFLGIGFSSFAIFRFFLHEVFRQTVHGSDFWEELTETIAISGIALLLFVFRKQLDLLDRDKKTASA